MDGAPRVLQHLTTVVERNGKAPWQRNEAELHTIARCLDVLLRGAGKWVLSRPPTPRGTRPCFFGKCKWCTAQAGRICDWCGCPLCPACVRQPLPPFRRGAVVCPACLFIGEERLAVPVGKDACPIPPGEGGERGGSRTTRRSKSAQPHPSARHFGQGKAEGARRGRSQRINCSVAKARLRAPLPAADGKEPQWCPERREQTRRGLRTEVSKTSGLVV